MTKNAKVKKTKGKASSPEQMKIKGTGRLDAKPAVEKAVHEYQAKVGARAAAEVAEDQAQDAMTQSLIDAGIAEYVVEGKDGIPYCAYIPVSKKKVKAKVRKIKRKKPDLGDGE